MTGLFIIDDAHPERSVDGPSEYARLRTGDMFWKIDLSKIKNCEVFAQEIYDYIYGSILV